VRHKTCIEEAIRSLELVLQSMDDDMPEDFWSIDLMGACDSLGQITGETTSEDLVNEIFSSFCMGK
jgi:tRNA modification GTPase